LRRQGRAAEAAKAKAYAFSIPYEKVFPSKRETPRGKEAR
jgi:hypothetical protein